MFLRTREAIANFILPEGVAERRRLERAANVCDLTELANRRAFNLAQPAAEANPKFAFVVFDINNFKKANDLAGHVAGDQLLKDLARVMQQQARQYAERCFRFGGDEFAAIIPAHIAKQFRANVERAFGVRYFGGFPVSITGEVGETFIEADNALQTRKAAQKAAQTK